MSIPCIVLHVVRFAEMSLINMPQKNAGGDFMRYIT
jgi:hypothetical protein